MTRYWSENWNLGLKLNNKIKYFFGWLPWAKGPVPIMPILVSSNFLHIKHPKFYFKFKMIKKLIIPYLAVWQPCIWSKGLPHGALNTLDVNFCHKLYTFWIFILYRKLLKNLKLVNFGWIGRHPLGDPNRISLIWSHLIQPSFKLTTYAIFDKNLTWKKKWIIIHVFH